MLLPGEVHKELAIVWVASMLGLGAAAIVLGAGSRLMLMLGASLAAVGMASAAAGSDGDVWRRALPLVLAGLGAYATGDALRGHGPRAVGLVAVGVAGSGILAWGLYQPLFGFHQLRALVASDPGLDASEKALYLARIDLGRPFGPFSLPGLLGGFLAAFVALTGAASLEPRVGRVARIGLASMSIAALALLLMTKSLGGLLALAFALWMVAAVVARRATSARPRRLTTAVVIAAAVLVVAASSVAGVRARAEGRSSLGLRMGNWLAAARMGLRHPLLGVGPGEFQLYYPRYLAPGGNGTKHAHSAVARALAETGIPGLVVLLALGGAIGRGLMRRVELALAAWEPIEVGWALAATALLVHSLVDIDLDVESLGIFTPFIVGVALASAPGNGSDSAGDWKRRVARVALALLLLLAMAPYVRVMHGLVAVDDAAWYARHRDRDRAAASLAYAIEVDPRCVTARLLRASESLRRGDGNGAVDELELARRQSPERGRVHLLLASALLSASRTEEACDALVRARRCAPRDREVVALVARLGPMCGDPR